MPFSITIRHISCVDPCDAEGIEALLEGKLDFYAKVGLNLRLSSSWCTSARPRSAG